VAAWLIITRTVLLATSPITISHLRPKRSISGLTSAVAANPAIDCSVNNSVIRLRGMSSCSRMKIVRKGQTSAWPVLLSSVPANSSQIWGGKVRRRANTSPVPYR